MKKDRVESIGAAVLAAGSGPETGKSLHPTG